MPITKLSNKPLRSETSARHRGRPLVVELHQGYIATKGYVSERYSVPWLAVFEAGGKISALEKLQATREQRRTA